MAPIKFEEDLRETLEKRNLTPSENAWKNLNASLDKVDRKKRKKGYFWFGIAASIVGVLWLSSTLLTNDSLPVEPILVDTPDIQNTPIQEPIEVLDTEQEEVLIAEVSNEQEIIPAQKSTTSSEQVIAQNNEVEVIEATKSIAQIEVNTINIDLKNTDEIAINEDDELIEVATQIVALNEGNERVSDEEIDSLLMEAQRRIAMKRIGESGMSVNAYALLFEVEEELDPTFKERVFDVISKNYHSIKNAVATRNE